MCGGKWESVEQQQPAGEIKMTERYESSQLSQALKKPSFSSVSQCAVTITYTAALPSPSFFHGTGALIQKHWYKEKSNSLPFISLTCNTYWEAAFKEAKDFLFLTLKEFLRNC